jgi:SAM-dependent methyltransferase
MQSGNNAHDFWALNDIAKLKLYNSLAPYYYSLEEIHRNHEQEISFLSRELPLVDYQKILDLGCGTGEHMESLRKQGYDMLGIDISPRMIRVAKERFPRLRLIQDDMRQLGVTGPFDAGIALFGTFNYLLDDLSIKKALRSIAAKLRQGGKLVLEVWNAIPIRKIKRKHITNISSIIYDGRVLHRNRGFELINAEDAKTMVRVDYIYQVDNDEVEDHHYMRAFYQEEIVDLIEEDHYRVEGVFGDFAGASFEKTKNKMILTAIKI